MNARRATNRAGYALGTVELLCAAARFLHMESGWSVIELLTVLAGKVATCVQSQA